MQVEQLQQKTTLRKCQTGKPYELSIRMVSVALSPEKEYEY